MAKKTERQKLTERLRSFAEDHPDGWDHDQWLGLVAEMRESGAADANDEEIGKLLEEARLAAKLERSRVSGLGPKRIEALVSRFGSVWNLKHAGVEAVAETPKIPRSVAEEVVRVVG